MPAHATYDYAVIRVVPRVEREIEADACLDEILYLGIRLRTRKVCVELDEDDLGHRQAERARDFAGDELRDQRLRPLARAAEFQHVHALIVGLDDRGQ